MVRAQYLLCRARGEVVTKACGRWGMLKACDWCTVTYLSFRMYLMLIFLLGEIEELCLLGNPVLLSKCLWSTLSMWLRFILGLNCKHSFWQAITPNAKIWRLFARSSSHSCLTGKTDYGMWGVTEHFEVSKYFTQPWLKILSFSSIFFPSTFGRTTLIVNSRNHTHKKCAINKKFPNRHV